MKIVLYLSLCLLLFACGSMDAMPEKVGHVYLPGESRMIRSENILSHRLDIYPEIVSYAHNDNFVVVKQQPDAEESYRHLGFDMYSRYTAYARYLEDTNIIHTPAYSHYHKVKLDSVNYSLFHHHQASELNSSRDIEIRDFLADSLIKHDPVYRRIYSAKFNYWIIDNTNDTLIGPLMRGDYLREIKRLGLPKRFQDELENE